GEQDSETTYHESARRYDLAAVILCTAVCLLALAIGYFHRIGDFGVESDFYGAYGPQADNLRTGVPYTYHFHPPGYMLLLAALTKLTGLSTFAAGKVLSALAAALIGAMTYLTFKTLYDARVALAGTMLLLVALVPYSFIASNDLVGAGTMLVPIWMALRPSRRWLLKCFLVGLFAGIAYLVRTNALVIVGGLGLGLLFLDTSEPRFRRRVVGAALLAAGFFLVTSPWLAFNWRSSGSPFSSTHYLQSAAHFHHPEGDMWGANSMSMGTRFHSLTEVILYDPVKVVKTYVKDVVLFYPAQLFQQALKFPAVLFAGAGLFLLLPTITRRRLMYVIPLLFVYAIAGLVGFYARYYVVLFPVLFFTVAYFAFHKGVLSSFERVTARTTLVAWALCLAIALLLAYQSYDEVTNRIGNEPRYLLDLAHVLRERAAKPGELAVAPPHLTYTAGMRRSELRATTPEEYAEKARAEGSRYIYYSEWEERIYPGIRVLSDPSNLPGDFRLIWRHDPSKTLVYEIVSPSGAGRAN
ncbi:MAG: ArnT family glycosyltransferase, partial [Gemmatimonadaceae bacterium]